MMATLRLPKHVAVMCKIYMLCTWCMSPFLYTYDIYRNITIYDILSEAKLPTQTEEFKYNTFGLLFLQPPANTIHRHLRTYSSVSCLNYTTM